jgi:RNA polymerase sigma-70 factor (ECF subfamily)
LILVISIHFLLAKSRYFGLSIQFSEFPLNGARIKVIGTATSFFKKIKIICEKSLPPTNNRVKKALTPSETHIDSFTAFLRQYEGLLFRVVNTYCSNHEDQKDLLQEIRLQLWRSFPKYDPGKGRSTWVYRIALNVAISWLRSKKRRKEAEQSEESVTRVDDAGKQAQIQRLYQLIQQLRPLDRALILLYLDDLSQQEIAEVMGISLSNVSSRVHRIKQQLIKLENTTQ